MNIFYTYIFTQNDITLVLGSVAEYNVLYYRKSQEKSYTELTEYCKPYLIIQKDILCTRVLVRS